MFNLQWQESGHPPFGFASGLFALIPCISPPGSGLLPVLFRQKSAIVRPLGRQLRFSYHFRLHMLSSGILVLSAIKNCFFPPEPAVFERRHRRSLFRQIFTDPSSLTESRKIFL
jgi:hypothetical protein